MPPPCLFLSHSGADTEAARELKRRILASPAAREAGLTVWFDKDDLEPGRGWQQQLERALTEQATAFAVYVGARGVINWVEREVREGLSRATGADAIPFIPVLGPAVDPAALPPFARQHQGVRDPLGDETELARLVKAALASPGPRPVALIGDPFVGLRAMTEAEADRFFGRGREIAEVLDRLRGHRLLAIVAESGAGKSSLVRAGVVPAFRGGALEDLSRQQPDERIWHVVVMRPGSSPLDGLRRAVTATAERLGLSGETAAGLRRRIAFSEPGEAAYALRCDLPVDETQTLLVVDQFEEVLTQTPEAERAPFIDFLLALADRPEEGIRVLLTMRADYFNLTRAHQAFFTRLQRDSQSAVYRLKGITPDGLADAIRRPLRMAGHDDAAQQEALLALFRRDVQDRPGDLALVQMALFVIWRRRKEHGDDLVNAYAAVNGVSGALADEADRVRRERLSEAQRALLLPVFVRLIRLGETGGVTRRIAPLDEFSGAARRLVEDLARDDHGRLLMVGDDTAEIAHEALITQWGWLQSQVNGNAARIRQLARLMEDAADWAEAADAEKLRHLANEGDAAQHGALMRDHAAWLAPGETRFVQESQAAIELSIRHAADMRAKAELDQKRLQQAELNAALQVAETAKEREAAARRIARRTVIGTIGLAATGAIAGWAGYRAWQSDAVARDARAELDRQLSDLESFWGETANPTTLRDAGGQQTEVSGPSGGGSPSGTPTWGVRSVGADVTSHTGRGCVVAIVGTGVDTSHPAFRGVNFIQKDFTGASREEGGEHSTHVAGTIFGRPVDNQRFGIAPGVTDVVVAKVLDRSGAGRQEAIVAAMQWVAKHPRGVDVICASLGIDYARALSVKLGLVPKDAEAQRAELARGLREYLQLLRTFQSISAVVASLGKGAVVIGPAGNDSTDKARVPVTSPISTAQGVISVGAVVPGADGHKVAPYSNSLPTLCAPGSNIVSAKPGGALQAFSGTSMACAHAAGVTALWWEYLRKTAVGTVTSRAVTAAMLKAARSDVFAAGVTEAERGAGLVFAPPAS